MLNFCLFVFVSLVSASLQGSNSSSSTGTGPGKKIIMVQAAGKKRWTDPSLCFIQISALNAITEATAPRMATRRVAIASRRGRAPGARYGWKETPPSEQRFFSFDGRMFARTSKKRRPHLFVSCPRSWGLTIGIIVAGIAGVICLERCYASCKAVWCCQ
jgi:hypothetical protein